MSIDQELLARAAEAADVVRPLREETERGRRLAPAAAEAVVRSGAHKLLVPRAYGGTQVHPSTMIAVIERIAQGDGSAGWVAMIGATSGLMSHTLDEAMAREAFGPDDVTLAGVFAPMGRARKVEGGYRVTGRWPFASGCEGARWRMGGVLVVGEDGAPTELLPSGAPDVRSVLFRADETSVIDTWDTSGLRGSGSHDMAVEEMFVPASRTTCMLSERSKFADYTLPFFGTLSSGVAAVGLGIARDAIDEFVLLAKTKKAPGSKRTIAHREHVQLDVARAEARLRAARAGLYEAAEEATTTLSLTARAHLRAASSFAAEEAAAVTTAMYNAGGGTTIYAKSPLQRHFRDAHVVTHHLMVSVTSTTLAGKALLGVDGDTTML